MGYATKEFCLRVEQQRKGLRTAEHSGVRIDCLLLTSLCYWLFSMNICPANECGVVQRVLRRLGVDWMVRLFTGAMLRVRTSIETFYALATSLSQRRYTSSLAYPCNDAFTLITSQLQ